MDSLIIGVDGQVAYQANATSLLTAHIGAGYDALTDDAQVNYGFRGGSSSAFRTQGEKPDEWLGRAGVGAEFVAGDKIEIHFNYEYEYRDDFNNNLIVATLRWAL